MIIIKAFFITVYFRFVSLMGTVWSTTLPELLSNAVKNENYVNREEKSAKLINFERAVLVRR